MALLAEDYKDPLKYKCCNGRGLLCCKNTNEFLENHILKTGDAEDLIWEKTVDKTVKSINGSWSWASAGLLATACQATIALTKTNKGGSATAQNWVYFIVVFIVGVLVAVAEHSLESVDRIAKELEIKVPPKKAALGDKDAVTKQKETIKKANAMQVDDNNEKNVTGRLLNFVTIEVNYMLIINI